MSSSKELTQAQAQLLIDGLEKRIWEKHAQHMKVAV
jgi:hypothetical protein